MVHEAHVAIGEDLQSLGCSIFKAGVDLAACKPDDGDMALARLSTVLWPLKGLYLPGTIRSLQSISSEPFDPVPPEFSPLRWALQLEKLQEIPQLHSNCFSRPYSQVLGPPSCAPDTISWKQSDRPLRALSEFPGISCMTPSVGLSLPKPSNIRLQSLQP